MALLTVTGAIGSSGVVSGSGFGVLLQAKRASNKPRNRMGFFIINWFIIFTAALRHCEERSSPDKKLFLSLDCFVVPPRNDIKDYSSLFSSASKILAESSSASSGLSSMSFLTESRPWASLESP